MHRPSPDPTDFRPGPRPGWVRSLQSIARQDWIALDVGSLLEEAERRTGLDDYGGTDFREPLRVLADSLQNEAGLHFIGRCMARNDLVNLLENRLEMTSWRKRHPAIAEVRVEKPIFITGLPRSGTSILHELLMQDPLHRVPLHWEVRHPCPPPEASSYGDDPRIAKAHDEIRLVSEVVPEFDTMHEFGGKLPTECIRMTAHSFRSDEFAGRFQVPSYLAWLGSADLTPGYEIHRHFLQLLSWRCPAERWVLKAPSHLEAIDALLAVYPDARIVWTHRDPVTVLASVASTLFATAFVRAERPDPVPILDWFGGEKTLARIEACMESRERMGDRAGQCFDIRYADLMRDPAATLASVYNHFEIPFEEEAEQNMRDYLAAKPKGVHGAHRYTFEQTGFDLVEEKRRFAPYKERYGVPDED